MLLAKRGLNEQLGNEAAEWAVTQLELGFDGKYLRQLAGVLGDENPFELAELFDRCVRELGLRSPKAESTVLVYAQEMCEVFAQGVIGRDYLVYRLYCLCIADHMRRELLPFYLLHFTLEDLKERGFSFYRREATPENFDRLLQEEIDKLMALPIEYT